jgi:Protein of unknown function (DUF2510)
MSDPQQPPAPPGWYPWDDDDHLRYWDGSQWGEFRDVTNKPPAGWHPDPERANTWRYWDGAAWTDQRAPMQTAPGAASASPSKRRGPRKMTWVLIILTVIMAAWAIGGGIAAGSECDEVRGGYQGAKEAGCEAGTAIGVGLIVLLWFMGFVVLSLIWFMTRPKDQ